MLNTTEKKLNNALVIANAAEVVARLIKKITGNDISNTLNGSKITNEIVTTLVVQRLNSQIKKS